MILQYNLNNSKIGQTKVNVIYSNNHNLSKVTIINGTRFRINYPYNLTNNLTSNVLVVQKVKFGNTSQIRSPKNINNNPKNLELNVRKVRILSNPPTEKIRQEKNITSPKKSNDERVNLARRLMEDKKNLELDIINSKII